MNLLVIGLLLWIGAHLFKRVLPGPRAAMGKAGRGVVAVLVLAGIVLMVIGFGSADKTNLYDLPAWAWHLNNLLMLVAIFLMDIGRAGGVVGAKVRHPMLSGVVVWVVAHLLVNGDVASIVLFGGLGLWAFSEMAVINRAEGPWSPPPKGPIVNDAKFAVLALVLFAAIAGVHYWLGYPVIALLA
ncbi:MAG: hypothetical protein HQ494_12200 [Rhodospirillales bacterium]|nr:hypothetical protein [Rhodospirillales bacterium]